MVGHRQSVINPHFTHYPRAITKLGRELVTEAWTQCDEEIGSKKSFIHNDLSPCARIHFS
jgi:hypothetical protein